MIPTDMNPHGLEQKTLRFHLRVHKEEQDFTDSLVGELSNTKYKWATVLSDTSNWAARAPSNPSDWDSLPKYCSYPETGNWFMVENDQDFWQYQYFPRRTITFMWGSNVHTTQGYDGDPIAPPSDPVEDGYTFNGWFTGPDGTGTKLEENAKIAGDNTYFAHFTQNAQPEPTPSQTEWRHTGIPYVEASNTTNGWLFRQGNDYITFSHGHYKLEMQKVYVSHASQQEHANHKLHFVLYYHTHNSGQGIIKCENSTQVKESGWGSCGSEVVSTAAGTCPYVTQLYAGQSDGIYTFSFEFDIPYDNSNLIYSIFVRDDCPNGYAQNYKINTDIQTKLILTKMS